MCGKYRLEWTGLIPSWTSRINQLLDTNVLSELILRPQPNPGVLRWAASLEKENVSTVALEELLYGLYQRPNAMIWNLAQDFFKKTCAILPVTEEIARRSAHLRADFQNRGQTRTQADMLIASTADVHGLTLVTRNQRDFEGCGISILNPFT